MTLLHPKSTARKGIPGRAFVHRFSGVAGYCSISMQGQPEAEQ